MGESDSIERHGTAATPGGLQRMFEGVPRRYDLLNRLLTFGLDGGWRRRLVRDCLARTPGRVLDLCTGTGDLAVLLAREAPAKTEIVAADYCEPMLAGARVKAERRGVAGRIRFEVADAGDLPFGDGAFDAVTIGFGFRNLVWRNPGRERHLAELFRVTAPGGRLWIVETSRPPGRLLRSLSDAWFAAVVGPVGGWVSGRRAAYRYLSTSARKFLEAGEVAALLRGVGFAPVAWRHLAGGIAALHEGAKGEG